MALLNRKQFWTVVLIAAVVAFVVFFILSAISPFVGLGPSLKAVNPNLGTTAPILDDSNIINAHACRADEICEVNALLVEEDSLFKDDPRFELGFVSNSVGRFYSNNDRNSIEVGILETEGPILSLKPLDIGSRSVQFIAGNNTPLEIEESGLVYLSNVILTDGVVLEDYGGNGNGYVCVDDSGIIFRSDSPCTSSSVGSYLLKAEVNINSYGGNTTTIFKWDGKVSSWEPVCVDRIAGESCFVGPITLTIEEVGTTQTPHREWVTLSSSGDFDKIYSSLAGEGGNYLSLPVEEHFPSQTHTLRIYNSNSQLIDWYAWGWDNGNISLIGQCSDCGNPFSIEFENRGTWLRTTLWTESEMSIVGTLYGDGTNFLGAGQSFDRRLAVSSSSTLTFYEKQDGDDFHRYFFASD